MRKQLALSSRIICSSDTNKLLIITNNIFPNYFQILCSVLEVFQNFERVSAVEIWRLE